MSKDTIFFSPNGPYITKNNGFYGVVDNNDREILPHIYSNIEEYKYGLSKVAIKNPEENQSANELFGVATIDGEIIIEPIFHKLIITEDDILTAIYRFDDKYNISDKLCGVFNHFGENIIPFNYQEIYKISNEIYRVFFGQVDSKGNALYSSGKMGLVNTDHKFIFNQEYDFISTPRDGFCILFKGKIHDLLGFSTGKYGLANEFGELIIPVEYDYIGKHSEGLILVFKGEISNTKVLNGAFGFTNTEGKIVIPLKFEYANDFKNNGTASVVYGGRAGTINKVGEIKYEKNKFGDENSYRLYYYFFTKTKEYINI